MTLKGAGGGCDDWEDRAPPFAPSEDRHPPPELNESVVAEGQDRVLTLPWPRTSSRRRREIIEGVGEAQQPLRAMRTKARDGFIKALRDAHRWLDELLFDPTHTIESLAVRESKSERSIRMTLSIAFVSPALAEAAMEGYVFASDVYAR